MVMSNRKLTVAMTIMILIPFGLVGSFAIGIYSTDFGKELFAVAMSHEEPADVTESKSVSRDHFQLKYPGNWKIAEGDEHFDIDRYFSIDTPGFSYVLFDICRTDGSPQENVQNSLEYYSEFVQISDKTSFDTWGEYSGVGVQLVGKYVGEPCVVRIFCHTSDDLSFTVTEFFDRETQQHVQPGFDLVEATFKLRASLE